MPDTSPILSLPLLLPAQAQKHVTHNEALLLLDVLAQLVVLDRDRAAPPLSPIEGDVHVVAAGATGDWAGKSTQLATYWQGGWTFLLPRPGWRAWVLAEEVEAVFRAGVWVASSEGAVRFDRLGVNADADATNRLSVSSPATLLNHDGAGHQLKLNKALATDTASLLYQTGFSGRAEMGLAGTDEFSVKVSPDGTAWTTALAVNGTTGAVSLPAGAVVTGALTGTAVTQSTTDTTMGRLTKVGDFGLGAFNYGDVDPDAIDLPTRMFRTNAAIPLLAAAGHVLHLSRAQNNQGAQIAFRDANSSSNPMAAFRHRDGTGTWSSWNLLFGRMNILGQVGQASGIPSGAVIERNSNANGEYVRFADGTQICTRTNLSASNANTALGSLFRSANVSWTFPAAFAAAPVVSGNTDDPDCWLSVAAAPTISSVSLRALAAVTKGSAITIRALAIGRWF